MRRLLCVNQQVDVIWILFLYLAWAKSHLIMDCGFSNALINQLICKRVV